MKTKLPGLVLLLATLSGCASPQYDDRENYQPQGGGIGLRDVGVFAGGMAANHLLNNHLNRNRYGGYGGGYGSHVVHHHYYHAPRYRSYRSYRSYGRRYR